LITICRYIAHTGFRKPKVKKSPLKESMNSNLSRPASKLERVLEAMKVEIFNIQTTGNIFHNLSRNERKALWELICVKDLILLYSMGIRHIVSSCSSTTENISQYVDYWLQPLMKNLPSYLKTSTELINEFKHLQIEPDTILVTVDVKSLYTCIPHKDGIDACKEALNFTKEDNPEPHSKSELDKFLLHMSSFHQIYI